MPSMIAFAAAAAQAAPAPSLPFVLKQVGPGVYAAIDGPEHKAGSNAGFVIGDDGVLVVDAFFTPDAARALVGEIRRLTPKPIRYVVNTHYHADHTGGDQALRDAGAIIIAHKNVRGWVRTNNINLFGDRITPELKARIEALPLPDLVTDKDLAVWLGSRKVVVRTVLGHTGGDLTVFVPDAKVLFTGDMLWRKVPPNLIDGSVREWAGDRRRFRGHARCGAHTYVPGHGESPTSNDVEDFRAYLIDLRRLVGEGRKAGLKDDALAQDVAPKLQGPSPRLDDQRPRRRGRDPLHGPGAGGDQAPAGGRAGSIANRRRVGAGAVGIAAAAAASPVGVRGPTASSPLAARITTIAMATCLCRTPKGRTGPSRLRQNNHSATEKLGGLPTISRLLPNRINVAAARSALAANNSTPSGEAKASSGTSQPSAGMMSASRWSGQPRPISRASLFFRRHERAVVMALAAAEAGAGAVDRDQRDQDQVGLDHRMALGWAASFRTGRARAGRRQGSGTAWRGWRSRDRRRSRRPRALPPSPARG